MLFKKNMFPRLSLYEIVININSSNENSGLKLAGDVLIIIATYQWKYGQKDNC